MQYEKVQKSSWNKPYSSSSIIIITIIIVGVPICRVLRHDVGTISSRTCVIALTAAAADVNIIL